MKTRSLAVLVILVSVSLVSAGVASAQNESAPLDLEYKQRAPALRTVPPRKIEEDTTQAVNEIDRQRTDRLLRDNQPSPMRRPDLDRDVTQGIQTRGLSDALRR
ncbi:MAG TPA: hypothetical protein VFS98_04855 [Methylomirabilota bacterium]|jgi:hypothetical protein|nr:hypothetical protein [Methylomirabilota bacterium]